LSSIANNNPPTPTISAKVEAANFESEIIKIQKERSLSIMEAILYFCNRSDIEVELVSKLITPSMKTKLKKEAVELHFIRKKAPKKSKAKK
jgi:hypothetical protein